jgi:hypothetical protein
MRPGLSVKNKYPTFSGLLGEVAFGEAYCLPRSIKGDAIPLGPGRGEVRESRAAVCLQRDSQPENTVSFETWLLKVATTGAESNTTGRPGRLGL